ncbi:Chromodomain Y-like protein [Operophtera brumata]|uniref:Chromodomain Y-like protein n=1 Tax=Operophtera brumata TaxID=104452 RepID=A0A0L7LUE7_OPEBR|nr:Chromodomain Y-like protein [Operophtera brumata]
MTSMEEGEAASEDVAVGNPEECHSAFHYVEEFTEHKEANNCTGKSPNENKAQVWAFLLWKCSSARDGSISTDNSWKLYQQWCRMAEAQRTAWITAGANVQALSKFAHAKVMELKAEDQLVPIQTPQSETKKRGRPRKSPKVDEDYHPSEEESDEFVKPVAPKLTVSQTAKSLKETNESVRNAQERVPAEERIARRTDRLGDATEASQFVVEKILAKRFNPRRKHEQNTWEPVKQINTPSPQIVKQVVKKSETPAMTPTGKARAVDQVKAWCGAEEGEPQPKKIKKEASSDDDDYSDSVETKFEKKVVNGQSPKASLDPELVKTLGLSGKGMPNIKGVIKVDPKHMPNLSTGVYIMSKSSGIMKIDSPGKIGPGLANIDQDVIRKQILAAKQVKNDNVVILQVKKTYGSAGQQVTEKTIITPSGQKIIQRTIQRPVSGAPSGSPLNILHNKKLQQMQVKVEGTTVKQLLEEGIGVDEGEGEGEEVNLMHSGHPPIMIRGEDGVLYQVAGENEAGQTLLVAAEGVEGAEEGAMGTDGEGDVMYDVLTLDPAQLAQLMPGGEDAPALQQVAVQVEGEPGEDATQVIAQLLQADLPSPDGSLTMTELDKEQYESITEAGKAQE